MPIELANDHLDATSQSWPDLTTSQTQPDLNSPITRKATNMTDNLNRTGKKTSLVATLCDSEVGWITTRSHAVPDHWTMGKLREELSDLKAMVSNNVRPSVRQASEKSGFEFSVETSQTITQTGRVFIQVLITRVK